ncbi:MAG: HD domain-containing protein [Solobacterium sp.]|nr:HD domain-containing protein [Solobacterium sp.]
MTGSELDYHRAVKAFYEYVLPYEGDPKAQLKIVHTFRTVENADRISGSLKLDDEQRELVQIIALLHDIGRFEQVRRWNDFRDSRSVDHALLGAQILSGGLIRRFVSDPRWDDVILTCVAKHSSYSVEDIEDEHVRMHLHILRDADKLDIFRVRAEEPHAVFGAVTKQGIEQGNVSEDVVRTFMSHECIRIADKKTETDSVVMIAAMIFDMHMTETFRMLKERDLPGRVFDRYAFRDAETIKKIRAEADRYIQDKCRDSLPCV